MKNSNDHYVPQFLLRRFSSGGKVYVFDKISRNTFATNPKNVMAERGYNSVTLKDGAWIEFEDKFTYVENMAKPVLDKLVETEAVSSLSPMEHASILTFLVVQHLRARATRDSYMSIGTHIRDRFPGVKQNDFPEHFDDVEFDKFALLKSTLTDLSRYTAPLVAKHMFLMKRQGAPPIYVSDNPLVMSNTNDFGPRGNIGLAVPGIEIYLPIGPVLVLALYCPTLVASLDRQIVAAEKRRDALAVNLFRGDRDRVAKTTAEWKLVRQAIEDGRRSRRQLVDDRLVLMTDDNLLYLNSLQVMWAFRYLVALPGDFSFANMALTEHPSWVDHPKFTMN